MLTRRKFFTLLTAPAIVHAGNLMPVRALEPEVLTPVWFERRIWVRGETQLLRWSAANDDNWTFQLETGQDMLEKTL